MHLPESNSGSSYQSSLSSVTKNFSHRLLPHLPSFLGVVTIIKLLYVEALPKLRSVIPGMQAYSWAHTFIDNLFDSMNGSYKNSRNRSGKPLLQALKPNSPHKDVWRQAKPKLNSMQFVTSDGKACNVPSIQNWLRTIENMKYLRAVPEVPRHSDTRGRPAQEELNQPNMTPVKVARDDLVKIAGSRWMRKAQDRSEWRALGEAYVQQFFG
ncbi:hypothetical protein MSG28_008779 [Choristoneura fumiferana]|uniref:Uncharacterized protein n=1 Tax=Choristoneura fumiferana TaxID=7141 RepID=A0ACC0J841_CHOFU|nr:hypothetical protein MSG28_008779 [Choristoneura fumiferana]